MHDIFKRPGVGFWERRILALANLRAQLRQISIVPRRAQRSQFVEQSAQRPNITLEAIGLLLETLGRHVKRCANYRTCLISGASEDSGDSKVTKFNDTSTSQEHVLSFQVSMQNFSIMTML